MSGGIDFWILTSFAVAGAVTDLAWGRIFNWLTFPMMIAGVLAGLLAGGAWGALGSSALGILAGLFLYGWMFWLGVMGGGDVKFLMAFGAWGGYRYAFEVAVLGVMLGGVLSVGVLLFKGKALDFGRRIYRFILSVIVKELELEFPEVDRKLTMPYGPAIAVAAVWSAAAHPLQAWGLL